MAREEGSSKNHNRILVLNLVVSEIAFICYAVVSLLIGNTLDVKTVLLRILFGVIAGAVVPCAYYWADENEHLFSWNRIHFLRFTVLTAVALFATLGLLKLPVSAYPFALFGIMLVLYSDSFTGILVYSLTLIGFSFCYADRLDPFFIPVLLFIGGCGCVLFANTKRSFRYMGSLLLFLVLQLLTIGIYAVSTKLSFSGGEILLHLLISTVSCTVILLLWFSVFAKGNLYLHDDLYSEINDTEHELLTKLKTIDNDAYFHAIHTAYLAEKCAYRIDCDMPLTKAGGYYHRIGLLQGKDTLQNALLVCTAHHFPPELIELLKEYGSKNAKRISREAAIVQISDAMVSSVSFLYSKDKSTPLDYGKIVDVIIRKKTESGDWNNCELTFRELNEIKKVLIGEKHYYDFLR
ncbi:MAG: hypothetical protein K6G07_09125 [Lachnospiraceae bacterium]|nr:hypothetical protein [Lachnospiraceae bacterium]